MNAAYICGLLRPTAESHRERKFSCWCIAVREKEKLGSGGKRQTFGARGAGQAEPPRCSRTHSRCGDWLLMGRLPTFRIRRPAACVGVRARARIQRVGGRAHAYQHVHGVHAVYTPHTHPPAPTQKHTFTRRKLARVRGMHGHAHTRQETN